MVLLLADNGEYSVETREASPAHLLTKIESFSMLSVHQIPKLESTEFEAGDFTWKVVINFDEDGHISVYLCMVGTSSLPAGWQVNVIFCFFLYNHISDTYQCFQGKARRFHASNSEWGFPKLTTEESLREASNGYVVKDKCVFGAEVFVIKKEAPVIENVYVHHVSDPYKREWKIPGFSKLEGIWTSVEFSAGGHSWIIKVHPNGNGRAIGSYVSIFLQCVDSESSDHGKSVYAACVFCLRNMLNDKQDRSSTVRSWFTFATPNCGFNDFIAIGDMREGFVVDDCCTLEIQLSVQALQEEALTLE